ncbi:Zinc finger C2H2-type [Sesbania bispinosa]|nr:Zinc finger C2H2-type [Sesbania bispinosa]
MGEKGLKSELEEATNSNSGVLVDNYMKQYSKDGKEVNFSNPDENTNTKGKTFTCNFCNKKFSCPQALGGHQNAHRQERALAKRLEFLDSIGDFEQPNIPRYGGSFVNRALDDSMIRKPSYLWTSSGFSYGHCWSGLGIMGRDATPITRPEEDGNAPLFPNATTNSLRHVINKPTMTTSDPRHSMPEETSKVESSNVDLELKL